MQGVTPGRPVCRRWDTLGDIRVALDEPDAYVSTFVTIIALIEMTSCTKSSWYLMIS